MSWDFAGHGFSGWLHWGERVFEYSRHEIPNDYSRLPESLKMIYDPDAYAWIGEEYRAKLMEWETLPEVTEDD
jgi:hypothetical protein